MHVTRCAFVEPAMILLAYQNKIPGHGRNQWDSETHDNNFGCH